MRRLIAGALCTAVLTGWSFLALELARRDPVSPSETRLSLQGEVRVQALALAGKARQALARGDTVLAWVYEPIVRGILGRANPLTKSLAAIETSEKPWVLAKGGPEAEKRFAADLAAIGEPLVSAMLGHVSDLKVEPEARCVLMRTLATRWPDRLARELARVLAHESYPITLGEAAVEAGRINAELASPGLVPDLRGAVARLRGWGRQYAILGLVLAEDRDSVALVRDALTDREPAVRRHGALYLAASGDMSSMKVLDDLARHDPDATTRRVAAVALSRLIGVDLPKFAAAPSEVREAYRRGVRQPPQPEVAIRQIVVLGSDAAAHARIAAARARVAAGETFESVAREVSEDRGITRAGRVSPPLTRARMVAELWRAIGHLVPGQVSRPVQSPACWHLVQLITRSLPRDPSFEEMAPALAERVIERKRLEFVENAMLPRMAMFRSAVHE